MHNPEQLCFAFMHDDKRHEMLARIEKRAISSMDFQEYEWHRHRMDRLAA